MGEGGGKMVSRGGDEDVIIPILENARGASSC